MHSGNLRVEATRGNVVESVHRISAAVVDRDGRLLASSGDPRLVTFWRSSAKPFQALPVVQDSAVDRWRLSDEDLALCCASHSSEPRHLDLVERFLQKVGCTELDLACGPHVPLSPEVAKMVERSGAPLTPKWSNCSGKHAGMLGLARHHGWPTVGYERSGHPVQERILQEVTRWTCVSRETLRFGVDGCTALSFALPLQAMATGYASLAVSTEAAAIRIREAMMAYPFLVAGSERLCTTLMEACRGRIVAKVGAAGMYCAALLPEGLGIALKVEDGNSEMSPAALLAVLQQVGGRFAPSLAFETLPAIVSGHAQLPIRNTRGTQTGSIEVAGALRFCD